MTPWPRVPFGEIAPLVRRPVPIVLDRSYPELGIRSFGKGTIHKPALAGIEVGDKRLFEIHQGDLLFNIVFAWEGAVAVASSEDNGRLGSHRFLTCVPDERKALAEYLCYYFLTPEGLSLLLSASPGGAGRNRTLGLEPLAKLMVPLPPIAEQRRIISQLAGVAKQIRHRQTAVEEREAELAAMLRTAFSRVVANVCRARMGDVAPLVRRQIEIDPDTLYTELGVRSFYKGVFHRRSLAGSEFSWQKLFRIEEGDLIFSNLMAWEQAIAVARQDDGGCVGNHRMLTCDVDRKRAEPNFILYYFKTKEGFDQIIEASPGSIARNKTLSAVQLPAISLPLPSLDAQQWFCDLQAKTGEAKAIQASGSAELASLLPALSNRVFGSQSGSTTARTA